MPTIGVLPRTITTTLGNRTSTMATRTTTIRTTQIGFVLFGILKKPFINTVGHLPGSVFQKKRKMQLSLFDIPQPKIKLKELFEAYFECRKNKRNTANALAFEIDYENSLVQLSEEINSGTYKIGRSIGFIVEKPVKREIFAADFRDRVVHHLVISKINHLFEKQFIYDSFSCRTGKGTHFGIRRVDRFIRQCSKNYTKDCYILKLDLQGFL